MPTAASLTREIGYSAGQHIWLVTGANEFAPAETEYVPELMWPDSIDVYSKMRNDSKIAEILRALTLPIRSARRWIDPNGAPPNVVKQIAEDLATPVLGDEADQPVGRTRDRFSLNDHFRVALLALTYGHMAFEQVYRIEGTGRGMTARLRKLAVRMPQTIQEIRTDRDGGLIGIRQYPRDRFDEPPIPVDRLVVYSHEREGSAWQGRSLLRPAYRDWRLKDEALRVWATSLRRNGMGSPVYIGAPNETDSQIRDGAALAMSLRVGEQSGAGIPNGADIRLKGVEGSLPDHEKYVRYLDEQIAGSVLAEFLKLGSTASGSRALGQTFVDFFALADQAIAEWVIDTFNEYVIEDYVDINWGPDAPAPRLVLEPVGAEHELTALAIGQLVQAGALTADDTIEGYLREWYRLPPKPVEELPPPGPAQQRPGEPGQQEQGGPAATDTGQGGATA